MDSTNTQLIPAPLSDTFPPYLTPTQWNTLYALTSTVIPALSPLDADKLLFDAPISTPIEALQRLADETADESNIPFRRGLEDILGHRIPETSRKGIAQVLGMLNSTAGALLLTYSTVPFHLQPQHVRTQILASWIDPNSRILFPPIRKFAKAIINLTKSVWVRSCHDVLYPAMEFVDRGGRPQGEEETRDAAKENGFYRFNFIEFEKEPSTEREGGEEDNERILECDVVIVGSGCGGAVVAAKLAKAGHKVIVVEKGKWYPTDKLPLADKEAGELLYEQGMTMVNDDMSMAILAGSTFGGGGAVNWSAGLQTQGFVREEWAEKHKLPFFLSSEFQNCLDSVSQRMGVSTENITHNHRNKVILEGSRQLGWSAKEVPQNTGAAFSKDGSSGRIHADGFCGNGCGCGIGKDGKSEGRKMGTTQTWLPDAARAGAHFIQTFKAERVLFADPPTTTPRRAIGISGIWSPFPNTTIHITIKARKTIISAGALHSPLLLLRSGLSNPNIGANLYLHPVVVVNAVFPEKTSPMEGAILTTVCNEFENLDSSGYGVKLETSVMTPTIHNVVLPWGTSGLSYKRRILKYQRHGNFIVLARDRYPGRVYPDPKTGQPRVSYTVHDHDRRHILTGIIRMCKLLYTQGATEIYTNTIGSPVYRRFPTVSDPDLTPADCEDYPFMEKGHDDGLLDPRFRRFLVDLKEYGLPSPFAGFSTAHQMGSCRMGDDEGGGSVVDPVGRVWGTKGLYVADASVAPTSTGVNPMLSVMAIAEWIARGVLRELEEECEGKGKGREND
ncbi:hypothetical protein RUND412_008175 [Rhizina undulata]